MKKTLTGWAIAALIALSLPLKAEEGPNKDIVEALKKAAPGLTVTAVKQSKIPGLFEIAAGPKVFYMTADGKYLLEGKMTDVKTDKRPTEIPGLYEFVSGSKLYYVSEDGESFIEGALIDVKNNKDLTAARLGDARVAELDKMGVNNMIVFKPKKPKHVVYVFTDIDCGYCRKLHSEIDQYLNAGIEIRYLFFPRAGIPSESYDKAVAVWCAKDRHAALTKAKKGEAIEMKQCDNPVQAHMKLGEDFGANGTPMLVTEKGTIIPGYVNAVSLVQGLEKEARK